jgi:hypothetical protein
VRSIRHLTPPFISRLARGTHLEQLIEGGFDDTWRPCFVYRHATTFKMRDRS